MPAIALAVAKAGIWKSLTPSYWNSMSTVG